jgi:nitrate reductase beta subunit
LTARMYDRMADNRCRTRRTGAGSPAVNNSARYSTGMRRLSMADQDTWQGGWVRTRNGRLKRSSRTIPAPSSVVARPKTIAATNTTYIALSLRVVAMNTGPVVRRR